MALAEDAATVLEQFVHDVANLPAEIAHLLEEIQAKDQSIQECRTAIHQRDNVIQKHVKASGCKVPHPKEEQFTKTIQANYEKAQLLQEEKCSLANKASLLLDRHVRRLDVKIRDLQTEGAMNLDPQIPSLIQSSEGNLVPPVSASNTGTNTPLNPVAFNVGGGSASIANAAMARMLNNAALSHNRNAPNIPPVAGMHPHSLLNSSAPDRKREMSASAVSDSKRRRLNANLGTLPNPSSGLRQTSLGPGTPKAQTPGSRAGSAGPRTKKFASKKIAPHQQSKMGKKIGKGGIPKKSARRLMGGIKASPSTTDNESQLSDASGSEEDVSTHGNDGAADDDEAEDAGYDDDGDDNALYCWCRTVSHGDMVACDNEKCKYEWFHWNCVGLTEEPRGRWLCPDCEKLDKSKIKLAR